ncbi:hypothetical protein N7478_009728 [Penicillium angulare]|uniref:uncharacterized protein n=1 Tax=Penicillium angulare TaxID=116970 RepID=UPI0025418B90|nr:uncharacterized protein N7478_009728 [Penicillium angulare]KAJ5266920.1 hypothetical protein N7478_009728 [Penicillium angulare]
MLFSPSLLIILFSLATVTAGPLSTRNNDGYHPTGGESADILILNDSSPTRDVTDEWWYGTGQHH